MRKLCLIALLVLLVPVAANADPLTKTGWRGWGPRVGVTMNPDQFHFGGHVDFWQLRQTHPFSAEPGSRHRRQPDHLRGQLRSRVPIPVTLGCLGTVRWRWIGN